MYIPSTNSLLEQWRDSYPDNDDYDPYDDDMYENHDLSEHLQSICDDLNITGHFRKDFPKFKNNNRDTQGGNATAPAKVYAFPVIHQPPQETSIEILHDQENVINSVQTFLMKFNRISFFETPKVLLLAWDRVFKIKDALGNKQYKPEDIQELLRELFNDVQNIHEELADYINTPEWNRPTFCNNGDDDDEDYTIAVTLDFSIMDSLIMENEHLDTIPEMESDEFIKSSVEYLVPIPSESRDFSNIKSECDVPDYDDSQTTYFSTFSNPLFDDSASSDDESNHEEAIHEMCFKTYSNPLFDLDEEIIYRDTLSLERLLHDDPIPLLDPLDFPIDVIPGNLKTFAKGFYPPSFHFLSFNWESYIVMSDSEDSTITYTIVSSPFGVAAFQAPPSPDYVPGPKYPPSPEFVLEPVYLEFMPAEDDILLAEEQPLLTAASPTNESDLDEDPKEDPKDD
nr:hypothetical protein [Tanacetum cinerariifolium]